MKARLPIFSGNLTFVNHCKYLYTRHLQKILKCRLFRLKKTLNDYFFSGMPYWPMTSRQYVMPIAS